MNATAFALSDKRQDLPPLKIHAFTNERVPLSAVPLINLTQKRKQRATWLILFIIIALVALALTIIIGYRTLGASDTLKHSQREESMKRP